MLDAETFHGHGGVRRWFQTMRDAFGDFGWEPQLAKAGGTDRPMQGTTLGDVTVTLAPGLPMEVDVTGVATHLGKYTGHLEGTAEIIGGTVFGEGTFTLVAANGDQLSGTFALTGPPSSGAVHPVSSVLTITGGTGRFADASGTMTVELVVDAFLFQ